MISSAAWTLSLLCLRCPLHQSLRGVQNFLQLLYEVVSRSNFDHFVRFLSASKPELERLPLHHHLVVALSTKHRQVPWFNRQDQTLQRDRVDGSREVPTSRAGIRSLRSRSLFCPPQPLDTLHLPGFKEVSNRLRFVLRGLSRIKLTSLEGL